MGMFQTSVFPVPAGRRAEGDAQVQPALRKDQQLTDFLLPLATAKYTLVAGGESLASTPSIETTAEIKSVYSPTHAINVQRPDGKHAIVKYEATNSIPTTDFRLLLRHRRRQARRQRHQLSARRQRGGLSSCCWPARKIKTDEQPTGRRRRVIFVVDRSGSMSGKKIEQAKEAVKFVLNNLANGDMFNIVAYDSAVESFKPELQKYDDETRKAALGFVEGIYAGGSTNIDGALTTALAHDQGRHAAELRAVPHRRPADRRRNERSEDRRQCQEQQQDPGSHLSASASATTSTAACSTASPATTSARASTSGPTRTSKPASSRLYSKMSSPVLTDVDVKVDVDAARPTAGPSINRVYPKEVYDIFAGEQMVIVGRYKKAGAAKVVITGKVGGEEKKFDFPATLTEKSSDQSYAFVEKLWAMRRIGEIIDEIDLKGKNDELVKELVELSTKHGILTPYTSFLADENGPAGAIGGLRFLSS